MKNINFGQLSSLWAKQLHFEFDDICWQYNIDLIPPIFEVSISQKTFGSWDAGIRTIKISQFLIINHSWAVTLAVFKHEIAHQICSEIFRSKEAPHGRDFQKACGHLGLPKAYWRATGDLPEELASLENGSLSTVTGRQYIAKIEKLLALAESANEHESLLAMQKANELMDKYNIDQLSANDRIHYTFKIINRKKKRIESYQRQICGILRDFFHVLIINASLYDPFSNQTYKTIEILGSEENAVVAEYCYYFLENQLAFLWNENRHKYKGATRTEKNSFYLGLLCGFHKKLQEQKVLSGQPLDVANKHHGQVEAVSSLVIAENQKLNEYVATRYPRLRSVKRSGPKIYKNTYDEGIAAGKKITFHKGVSQEDGNQGKVLC